MKTLFGTTLAAALLMSASAFATMDKNGEVYTVVEAPVVVPVTPVVETLGRVVNCATADYNPFDMERRDTSLRWATQSGRVMETPDVTCVNEYRGSDNSDNGGFGGGFGGGVGGGNDDKPSYDKRSKDRGGWGRDRDRDHKDRKSGGHKSGGHKSGGHNHH